MPEIPITPPQVIPSTYISRKYYNVSGDNTQNFGTPANTTSIGQISVYMDGKDIPSDSADYPWIFNDEEKEVQFRTGGVPPEGAGLEVARDIFLNFDYTGFPAGYNLDARVLNRIFNQSLFQSQELIEDGDYAWNAWSNSSLLPAPTPTQAGGAMMVTAGGSWAVKTSGIVKNVLGLETTADFGSLSVSSTDLSSVNSVISGYTTVDNISAVDVSSGVHGKLYHSQTDPNTYETQPDNFSHDLVLKSFGVEADSTLSSHSTNLGLELSSASSLNFTVLNHFWFGTNQPLGGNNSIGTQVGAANRVGLHSALHIDSSGNFFPFYASTNIHQIRNPTSQFPDKILPKIASKGNLIAGKAISVASDSESGLYGGGYLAQYLGGAYTTPESNIKAAANLPDILLDVSSNQNQQRDFGSNMFGKWKATSNKVQAVYKCWNNKTGSTTGYTIPIYLVVFNRKIGSTAGGTPDIRLRHTIQTNFDETSNTNSKNIYFEVIPERTQEFNVIRSKIWNPFGNTAGANSTGGLPSYNSLFPLGTSTNNKIFLRPIRAHNSYLGEISYFEVNNWTEQLDTATPLSITFNDNFSLALWLDEDYD